MTDQAAPTPGDTVHRRSFWSAAFVVALAINVVVLVSQTRHGGPWVGYWWPVTAAVVAATVWVIQAEQRKEAWGDKKTAMWVWHWFTGAPLILFDDPKLPWWRDVWNCRPWLDTTPTQETPDGRRIAVGVMRTLAVASLIVLEYKRSGAPDGTGPVEFAKWGIGGTLALAGFAVGVAWLAVRKAMDRWWIIPGHLVLQRKSGTDEKTRWPVDKRPRSWIHITRAWENGKRGVRFRLPPNFDGGNRGLRDGFLASALDITDLQAADIDPIWDTDGRRKSLTLKPAKRMPAKVLLSHPKTRQSIADVTGQWDYWVGYTNGFASVVQSLEDDAPHILIAGPTKTGKSQLVKVVLWQLLTKLKGRGRARIFVLDVKGYSHLDFEGRPGVIYARTIPEIARALTEVIALALERGSEALAAKQAGREPSFAPVFVVFEDIGAAMSKLPAGAQQAWDDILAVGRGVAVHAIALPQRPDVQYLGRGSIRDNLGNRMLMSGHGDSARKMVAQDVVYETPAQKRGRFVVLDGLVGVHTQGVLDDAGIIETELDVLLGPRTQGSHDLGVSGNPSVHVVDGVPVLVDGTSPTGLAEGEEPAGGGGFHTHTVSQPLYDGNGNMPPDQHVYAQGDQQLVPGGATPSLSTVHGNGHHPPATSTVPDGVGVMTPSPAAPPPSPRPVAPQNSSPSPSRLSVPGIGVGGMGSGSGGTEGLGGPDPVTLREGFDRGVFGGVKYGTVETARKRARREGRWWVPVVATRPARGGMVAELYDATELRRWWDSLPRSLANRPKDWVVYYIVPGGRGAVTIGADVKVGFCGDIDHRVGQLAERREHVVKLEHFTSRTDAHAREKYLHDRYAPYRKSSDPLYEVFTIRGRLARDLADLLVAEERTA